MGSALAKQNIIVSKNKEHELCEIKRNITLEEHITAMEADVNALDAIYNEIYLKFSKRIPIDPNYLKICDDIIANLIILKNLFEREENNVDPEVQITEYRILFVASVCDDLRNLRDLLKEIQKRGLPLNRDAIYDNLAKWSRISLVQVRNCIIGAIIGLINNVYTIKISLLQD